LIKEEVVMKSWGIYVLAAIGFAAYGAATKANRDDSGAIVGQGTVDAFHVNVGDCFDDTDSMEEEVSSLPGVPCSDPHDNEAFAIFDVTITDYPGGDAMSELANESCIEHFESFVGLDYPSSSLDVFAMYPSVQSWKRKDREIICSVYDMEADKLVGSMQGRAL
jgi:hypothetical protein